MNFFKDAEAFMKNKKPAAEAPPALDLNTSEGYQKLFNECRRLYENATRQEIDRAIEKTREFFEPPYPRDAFMKKLRTYLED